MAVLPLITAAFAAGIVVASTAAVPAVVQLVITPAAFAASWILYLLKKKKPALVLLLFLFCCLGTAAASLAFRQLQAPLQPFLEAEGDFTGYISSVLPEDGEVSRFVFYAAEISLSNGRTYELNAPLMVRLYNAPAGFAPVYGLPLQLREDPAASRAAQSRRFQLCPLPRSKRYRRSFVRRRRLRFRTAGTQG